MSFSCELERVHNNRSGYKTRTEKMELLLFSRRVLQEEVSVVLTERQSDPVMAFGRTCRKCPRENEKTNLHIDFCHQGSTGAMSGLTAEGISRRIQQRKHTRLVNRGRNDTVVCLLFRQCGFARRGCIRSGWME